MSEKRKKRRKGIIILSVIFGILIGLLILTWSSNAHLTKTKYSISSPTIPTEFDEYKILQLSDIHDKEFGDLNSNLIRLIEKEDPDIVVATGDMINSTDRPDDFKGVLEFFNTLAELYDVYYIDGNHETAMDVLNSDYYNEWISQLQSSGTIILNNKKMIIENGESSIDIFGLWYNGRYYNNMGDETSEKYYLTVEDIEKLIGKTDPNRFNLLLTHNPVYFEEYAKWGANLTLAGHIHGGVIRIPFKGGLISPERVYWPEYDAGEFNINTNINGNNSTSTMIVNRGLGNGNSGYRFLNWPDVSIITLHSS